MNIVICEDDINYRNFIKSILDEHINKTRLNATIALSTSDADAVMNYVNNNAEVTVYYLDVKLCDKKTGFDIAAHIRQQDYISPIIFITSYGDMMPLTYEYKLEALDYIVKNNSDEVQERIIAALEFAEQRQKQGYVKCLNIQNKQKNFSVPFDEICYIESIKSSHKLNLYYDNGIITFYGLLKDVHEQLDDRFLRCHKSIIINKDKIISVDKKQHLVHLGQGYSCVYSAKYRGDIEK